MIRLYTGSNASIILSGTFDQFWKITQCHQLSSGRHGDSWVAETTASGSGISTESFQAWVEAQSLCTDLSNSEFLLRISAPENSEFQFKIWKIILKLGKLLQNLGKLKKSASRCRIDSVEASQRRLQTLPTHPPRSRYDSCAFQGSQREKWDIS